MPLTTIIVVLIMVGVILWAINRFISATGPIKSILNAIVIIAFAVWLLRLSGVLFSLFGVRAGA